MARWFSYEGDHEEVTLYGVTFPQGEPVPVDAEPLLTKLAGNSHFKERAPVPAPVDEPAQPTEPPQEKRKYTRRAK